MNWKIYKLIEVEIILSVTNQDIAFFDEHKTGELISRLTTDIQDFKSSFKSCISQGKVYRIFNT